MSKPLLSLALSLLLLGQAAAAPPHAPVQSEKASRRAEKVKAKIATFGTGESARVRVKLRNRNRVTGYIREAGDENFTVVEPKSGLVTVIPYAQVKDVNPNRAVPIVKAVALGVGVIVGFSILVAVMLRGS